MNDLHPDVVLAIKHREERERREALLEQAGEPDLREIVADLAGVLYDALAWVTEPPSETDAEYGAALRERAAGIARRLAP